MARGGAKTGDETTGSELGAEEPLADWERELLEGKKAEAAVVAEGALAAEAATAEAPAVEAPAAEAPAADKAKA